MFQILNLARFILNQSNAETDVDYLFNGFMKYLTVGFFHHLFLMRRGTVRVKQTHQYQLFNLLL